MYDDSRKYTKDSDTSSDSEEKIDTYKERYVEEDDNVNFFRDLVPDTVDGLETIVFSITNLDALKEKENYLREKEEGKYFRCKLDSLALYGQITSAMTSYFTDNKFRMMCHPWLTQLNESTNSSAAAYVPKTKNFGGTLSLKMRVGITAAVMELGYYEFWSQVFHELALR